MVMNLQDWALHPLWQLVDGVDGVGLLKTLALCLSGHSVDQPVRFLFPTPPELAL